MAIGVGNFGGKPKGDRTSQLLTLGGMAAGGIAGGPAGIATGGQFGGMAGGMLQKPQAQPSGPVETSAIDRRMQKLDQTPLMQIRESIDSLQYLPDPAMRQELGKPLLQAEFAARGKKLPGVV